MDSGSQIIRKTFLLSFIMNQTVWIIMTSYILDIRLQPHKLFQVVFSIQFRRLLVIVESSELGIIISEPWLTYWLTDWLKIRSHVPKPRFFIHNMLLFIALKKSRSPFGLNGLNRRGRLQFWAFRPKHFNHTLQVICEYLVGQKHRNIELQYSFSSSSS